MSNINLPLQGGCACGKTRYCISMLPMYVHCCHCTWCQRETGSAFVLNAIIESSNLTTQSEPLRVHIPSHSGAGQTIARCPECLVALWSTYSGAGPRLSFLRVGTLDTPAVCPPDIYIFTSTKQPWVVLPDKALVKAEYYDWKEVWSQESIDRWITVCKIEVNDR